jgi:hypothetical protein
LVEFVAEGWTSDQYKVWKAHNGVVDGVVEACRSVVYIPASVVPAYNI